MGSCFSSTAATITTNSSGTTSALVITIDGSLKEYSVPVTVSSVLGDNQSSSFLCSSDGLYPDKYILALGLEVGLRPGQVYFEIPRVKLGYPLSGTDMGALVAKASSAIAAASEKRGRSRRIKIMLVGEEEEEEEVREERSVGMISISSGRKGRVEFQPCSRVRLNTIVEV